MSLLSIRDLRLMSNLLLHSKADLEQEKSVVSLYRHITNHQNHRSSLLLTYTTTLKLYLAACCRGQSVQAAGSVGTTYKKTYPWGDGGAPHYGEIIIDEA